MTAEQIQALVVMEILAGQVNVMRYQRIGGRALTLYVEAHDATNG